MKKYGLIVGLISIGWSLQAQVAFKTRVTSGPFAVGESFPVQYVLETTGKNTEFYPPDFKDFRIVAGPSYYEGMAYSADGPKKIKNIVYNLEALHAGRFIIPGARAKIEDDFITSDEVSVDIISRAEAARKLQSSAAKEINTAYFLKPGDDPYRKIKENMFVKVMVDRKTCFVGEPVTATFKLYSRMISRSDIVKNPGFYGFTVLDVAGLDDKQVEAETINGKKFDVHTVRRVQLYPLRAGLFAIDPMEVSNHVEFSRTVVNKKPEQEILEGVVAEDDSKGTMNTETYESSMRSEPVTITVKPSPKKNQPADYNGATGHFSITISVNKNELSRNEEGKLTLVIAGKGNFTQLAPPVIRWPDSLEGFEPEIVDSLDKNNAPLKGSRVFHHAFVSAKPGEYIIPSVTFSFFDPDSATYKTVTTRPVKILVNNKENIKSELVTSKETGVGNNAIAWLIAGLFLLIAVGAWLVWFVMRKRKKEEIPTAPVVVLPSVEELIAPARLAINDADKIFYTTCQQCAWHFFAIYFGLAGSGMNNRHLQTVMQQKGVDEQSRNKIIELLQECEIGVFAGATIEADKNGLLEKMKTSLEEILRYI